MRYYPADNDEPRRAAAGSFDPCEACRILAGQPATLAPHGALVLDETAGVATDGGTGPGCAARPLALRAYWCADCRVRCRRDAGAAGQATWRLLPPQRRRAA